MNKLKKGEARGNVDHMKILSKMIQEMEAKNEGSSHQIPGKQ